MSVSWDFELGLEASFFSSPSSGANYLTLIRLSGGILTKQSATATFSFLFSVQIAIKTFQTLTRGDSLSPLSAMIPHNFAFHFHSGARVN
jgi:hypothetical protein